MKDCYKKFWKLVLTEKIQNTFSQFTLRDSASKNRADSINPSSKPVIFAWNPIDKLIFTIVFVAPGKQDAFEAIFYWSEQGKVGANKTEVLDYPFAEQNFELANAAAMLQTISRGRSSKASDTIFNWEIWRPKSSIKDQVTWKAEFIAEELRVVSDEEARQRMEFIAEKAMIDIKSYAIPWFERKLESYKNNRKRT